VTGDVFDLTPLDVRKQEFRRALRGYEPEAVEDFRMRVADALERVIRERALLEERLESLTEQLRGYRERERAMNEALVAAQQLREEMRGAAEREAQVIMREAEVRAERLLDQARGGERAVQDRMESVERQFHAYVVGFRQLLERQLAELRALDGSDHTA
jgi:DivIVA domain-containing protein